MKRARLTLTAAAALLASAANVGADGFSEPRVLDAQKRPLAQVADAFTPVVARVLGPPTFFVKGTDGRAHVAYDIEFQNAKLAPATLLKLEVVDAENPSKVLFSVSGNEMLGRLRALNARPATDAVIEPNGGRVLLVELEADSYGQTPRTVLHRVSLLGAANPATTDPTPLEYTILPYNVAADRPMTIGPPLSGKGWIALNGCCAPGFPHRSSFASLNGQLTNSQRYAIDWMRMTPNGHLVVGDPSRNENWADYGAEVLAVADGTVISMLDLLDDNTPGALPDPRTITVQTVEGNHVVLNLGHGLYCFYAHLKKGSIRVKVGDRVRRGERLGLLGNTGNSSAPHLHLHLQDGLSSLGSSGVPYVIDSFAYDGLIPLDVLERSNTLTENFGGGRLAVAQPRKREYPLAWTIIDFR